MWNRDVFIESLKDYICEVEFTKANGEVRVMQCTRHESYLPVTTSTVVTEDADGNAPITVYDVEKADFRTFIPSRVKSFQIVRDVAA